jgi:hypothetical protein
MFMVLSITLIALIAVQTYARGARSGLWWGWLVALLLVPSWMIVRFGALTIDLRTVAAVTGLVGVWLFGRRLVHHTWLAADFLIGGLVAIQIASEFQSGQFGLLSAAEIARIWLLPYLVGRCFLGSERNIRDVLPAFARTTLVLSLYAVMEAVTHVNPLNELMGKVYGVLEAGEGYRWGLKRAQAFFDHPIYLGFLLVLILPWALVARRLALKGESPLWWKYLPIFVGVALACTASRGPVIAGILTICVSALLTRPRWWVPALGFATVSVAGMLLFQGAVVEGLASIAGGTNEEPVMLVIGDREVAYTGTSHRVLLFQVYDHAVGQLEPLGYGSQLRGVNIDDVPERFRSIDCHYLLFLLQRGPLGLGMFVLFALVTLGNLASVAWKSAKPSAGLAAGMFGAMALVSVMMISVWLAPDFGAAWLFGAGLAGNLKSFRFASEREAPIPLEWNSPRPLLVAGHAPERRIVEVVELEESK